jgi:hypothetical protein
MRKASVDNSFKYLAIKNWKKYQPKNTQNLPWIRDYKEREFDPEYARLTALQRYMLDACCRLRGRRDCNLSNDPLWIVRSIAMLPRERHNATAAIRELISCGFLILTHQQNEPLVEESKEKESEVKVSKLDKIPANSDLSIEAIAKAHPNNAKPVMAERAISMQLDRLIDTRSLTAEGAMAYLLERTNMFAAAVRLWPEEKRGFVPEAQNWFAAGSFEADESLWQLAAKNGETNGSTKLQRNLARLASLDKV